MGAPTGTGVPRARSLTLRMVLVAVLTPLVALALLAGVVILLPQRLLLGLVLALGVGSVIRVRALVVATKPPGRVLTSWAPCRVTSSRT